MQPGARVNRYVLSRPLGKGGQGSVWEAFTTEQSHLRRALKLIDLRGVEKDKAERAWREAEALHDVTHPGLVPCREFFRDSDTGLMGLVFDLVPGQTLFAAARDPRMTNDCMFAILEQLASILAYVHALGIVHRDLKPTNVLITDAFWSAPRVLGGVKLVDFGISARAGNPTPVTNPGSIVGTVPYLPPDLVCPGLWTYDRDGFARDVFAFGVMGWELLHGRHPTDLSPEALLSVYADVYRDAHQQRRPWPPPSSNEPWLVALRACLNLDPQHRPAHGAAILDIVRTGQFIPHIAAGIHGGATALHAAPTRAPSASSAGQTSGQAYNYAAGRTSTSPYSPAPLPAPPHYAHTPVPQSPPAPPKNSSQHTSSILRWLGFVLAGGLGAFIFWLIVSSQNTAPNSPSIIGLPTQAENTFSSQTSDLAPCCLPKDACTSGRTCKAAPCAEEALPERTWGLRVTGVLDTIRNEDLAGSHPKATLCMRNDRSGEQLCLPMTAIAKEGGDRRNVLQATTSDLKYGRMTVRVLDGTTTFYPATKIADNRDGIKTSILCRGMRLRVGPRESAPLHVLVFLD